MSAEEEMKRVKQFRKTGQAYVAPDDDKIMDHTTTPSPNKKRKPKKKV